MIGIKIGIHFEDEPMRCRECGEPMTIQAMVLQIGEATQGDITPIEGLCEKCQLKILRGQSGDKTAKNE